MRQPGVPFVAALLAALELVERVRPWDTRYDPPYRLREPSSPLCADLRS